VRSEFSDYGRELDFVERAQHFDWDSAARFCAFGRWGSKEDALMRTLGCRLSATLLECAVCLNEEAAQTGGTTMTHGVLTTSDLHIRSDLKLELNRASRSQPISRFQEQEHLAQADWHVSQMKTHIVRQRIRVQYARDTGQSSELPDSMLHALEASLYAFERHRDLIVSELKRRFSE
jgi:hypothetical protein